MVRFKNRYILVKLEGKIDKNLVDRDLLHVRIKKRIENLDDKGRNKPKFWRYCPRKNNYELKGKFKNLIFLIFIVYLGGIFEYRD